MSTLANQLKWLISIRLIVITSLLVPNLLLEFTARGGAPRLYSLAALSYVVSLVYIAQLKFLSRHPRVQAYVQFVGDLVLITGVIYQLGGLASPFSVLYLVVIGVASHLLLRPAGLTVAAIAWVLYSLLMTVLTLEAVADGAGEPFQWERLFQNLTVHLFGFLATAMLTSFLAQNANRAEKELMEKRGDLADLEEFHRDVIESISSGLITTNMDDRITRVNQAAEDILRASEADLVGSLIYKSTFLDLEAWQKFAYLSDQQGKIRDEVILEREDERFVVGFSINSLTDAEGHQRGHILIFQDLSFYRRLQDELRIKDRMAAVGELAAGIAHEIGNPLAAISGSVQMLTRSLPKDGAQGRLLDIILQQSRRLDRIIKGFLQFARPKERESVEFDVAKLLQENSSLLRNSEEVSNSHRIRLELNPSSAHLIADPDQISQIFWNLARNALRAMPEGGELRVVGELCEQSYRIQFIDDGEGMSERERAKLFHPFKSFFDEGTGIGMAIVYRIVQEHGGRIGVDSKEGVGTTVTVELPTVEAEALVIPAGV